MPQISATLLDSALTRERGVCFLLGGVGDAAHLAGPSDPAPFADEAPLAEQVRLHVQDVETGHAARVVGAREIHSGHSHPPQLKLYPRLIPAIVGDADNRSEPACLLLRCASYHDARAGREQP